MAQSALERLPGDAQRLFGLTLPPRDIEAIGSYLRELVSWSRSMNLVGADSLDEIVQRHVLDSLAPLHLLSDSPTIADFGSGAGFPGIPIGIVLRESKVHLVEARRKRCSFLRHVTRVLRLDNVTVWEARGEEWKPRGHIDAVIGRALRLDMLDSLARRILEPGGRLLAMRKASAAPVRAPGFSAASVFRYRLPGGELHEVQVFRRIR